MTDDERQARNAAIRRYWLGPPETAVCDYCRGVGKRVRVFAWGPATPIDPCKQCGGEGRVEITPDYDTDPAAFVELLEAVRRPGVETPALVVRNGQWLAFVAVGKFGQADTPMAALAAAAYEAIPEGER